MNLFKRERELEREKGHKSSIYLHVKKVFRTQSQGRGSKSLSWPPFFCFTQQRSTRASCKITQWSNRKKNTHLKFNMHVFKSMFVSDASTLIQLNGSLGRHGKFEPGKAQYSTPFFLTGCLHIETQNLGKAQALGGLASRGAPEHLYNTLEGKTLTVRSSQVEHRITLWSPRPHWYTPEWKPNILNFSNLCIPNQNSMSSSSTSVAWLLIAAVFCAKHSHFLTEFPPHWWMAWQERTTTIEWTDWDRELWKEPIYSPQKETIHHVGTAIYETEQPWSM